VTLTTSSGSVVASTAWISWHSAHKNYAISTTN
jgi:hypothetical protein